MTSSSSSSLSDASRSIPYREKCRTRNVHAPAAGSYETKVDPSFAYASSLSIASGNTPRSVTVAGRFRPEPRGGFVADARPSYTATSPRVIRTMSNRSSARTAERSTGPSHRTLPNPSRPTRKEGTDASADAPSARSSRADGTCERRGIRSKGGGAVSDGIRVSV